MTIFDYHNNQLMAEDVPLSEIANNVGTPVYVYSKAAFTGRLNEMEAAFKDIPHLICFAVKTCANLSLLKLVAEQNQGADIVSGGELFKALRGNINPGRVVFSGVGKTEKEIQEALTAGILMFNAESEEEIDLLGQTAGRLGKTAQVTVRVNPDVDAKTHPYISTGLKDNKFGISREKALAVYRKIADNHNLEAVGIACHIGSQLTDVAPLLEAADRMMTLALELKAAGHSLKYFDMGGGLGVCYNDETPPSLSDYAQGLKKILQKAPEMTLIVEPGRFVAANSAVLLTKVLYNKENGGRNFVVADAAMNDLTRPSLYGAFHAIKPLVRTGAEEITVDVVGPVCESTDFLVKNRSLPKVNANDVLAVMSAGAYGFTMSSNYNARVRAAEVLVDGAEYRIIKPRETYEDLIKGEE